MKKRISLCVVLALLLSLAAPARAAGNIKITATPYLPEIKIEVVVPAYKKVYINPYQIPVKVGGSIEDSQIISEPASIENLSEVPVKVDVEVTGTVKSTSDMLLQATSTTGTITTAKRAFIYFEIKASSSPDTAAWDNGYDADAHVVVRESTKAKKGIVTLAAENQANRYGVFHLTGDCVQNPREEWTARDGVSVEIIFTFSPLFITTEIP